jgi:transposase
LNANFGTERKKEAMTKKATRKNDYNDNEPVLYLAFELSLSEWKLGFTTGLGQKPRIRAIPGRDLVALRREISGAKKRFGLPESTQVVSCYEAGRDGFWLNRALHEADVDNIVVDSSSIEVNRRARRAKADGLDARKLVTMLVRYHLGESKIWSVVRPPSPEDEDGRQLHRELRELKKDKTRTTSRIKALLITQGIRPVPRTELSPKTLEGIRLWNGSPLPAGFKLRLNLECNRLAFIKQQIRTLQAERRRQLRRANDDSIAKTKQLNLLCGIGPNGSWLLTREFFAWRKFHNRREVGSLAGLTPTPYQSGGMHREQGISRAGNRHVRAVAVELAWSWLRFQPDSALSRWYMQRFAHGGTRARKVGIVALARRLLVALWRFLETGLVPEGAKLKVAA